ncbi:putative histone deacetylase [Rosa chinensis]|uniref:Putative histone deacetylase n=1 Tax=Rosa chinensis TaxID=74649 RepID=A0A2P6PQK2_ROSCH|nr:putative histone deacetylase [Rosa chinensis]
MIIEVPPVTLFPNYFVQQKVLSPPFHNQAIRGGTILAAKLAKERGWAINVGGLGFIIIVGEKEDYEARRFINQRVEVAVSRGTTTTEYLRKMKLLTYILRSHVLPTSMWTEEPDMNVGLPLIILPLS